ncbi:NAD(+)/NADH kinase [Halobacteriaceae archaeon GCM10025711]
MRVGIVAQKGKAHAAFLAAEIAETLDVDEVWFDAATAATLDEPGVEVDEMAACDLVVSIGGDGTFLFAARGADTTPVLGVNLGEVGFLNAVAPDDAVDAVASEVERFRETGSVRYREVPRVVAAGDGWELPPALNEVAVHGRQRGHGNGLSVEVRVDGALYTAGHADGVLVATPTGSTAYNLSEGGPLLHPSVGGLVVTSMCSADRMPPLVTSLDAEITVRVDDADEAIVSSDGSSSSSQRLDPPALVTVARAAEPARVAGPDVDFFQALGKIE